MISICCPSRGRPEYAKRLYDSILDTAKAEIEFLPIQPGAITESFAEIDKSVEMLEYKPTTNVDVGISKFVEWYNEYHRDK